MLTIRLLGVPSLLRDGQPVRAPRGRKSWSLLAYLALAERASTRQHLAEVFFADAEDPLGALRWTLSELRRALGAPGILRGDPLVLDLGDDVTLDVRTLAQGADPAALLDLGGVLLEGLDLPASPAFESWLVVERHRLAATAEARLRQSAMGLLAMGRPHEAIPYANAAVTHNRLEEGNHELLVRCLAMSGDGRAARRQVALAEDLLHRELGVTASPSLLEAASPGHGGGAMVPALSGRAAATSQLEAGRAAIVAGAVEAGLQCLRRAVAEAAAIHDEALHGRALGALGSALVHATRGRDEEGAVVLHEAIQLATRAGDRPTTVTALRQLGFVDVQAGRRATADAWLEKAAALAETDEERAAVLGVKGMSASDRGNYPAAFEHLGESVERADRCADRRQQAWSLSLVGRAHLLRGEHRQAGLAVTRALELVREQRWLAFLPWPRALMAEIDLEAGAVDSAAEGFEEAWAMANQLGDPCWEGMAARGLALVDVGRDRPDAARNWLTEAVTRSSRVSDRYQWVHAHVLDTLVTTAIDRGETSGVERDVAGLAALAARCDMRELVVRSHLHLARLGDPGALKVARLLAVDIDNPALAELVARP